MDIRILRDGIEIGPFPEETVHTLLQQGNIAITDLAWRPGMPQWVPLANLLYAAATPPPPPGAMPPPPPPPPAPQAVAPAPIELPQVTHEPATPKQKAFLSYMGVHFSPEIDREEASHLVNEAMESPKDAARLAKWNKERLKLHPELFAAEIQAAKEQRAQHYYEVCETQGAPWFTKVTKAHCQVLVGFLDVHHPHWDADEREAPVNFFFPAIAEKFPQLLTKEAKGKFKYSEGPKVAKELAQRSPVMVKARRTSPVAALARGFFFGVLILVMLWFVKGVMDKSGKKDAAKMANAGASSPSPTTPAIEPTTPPNSLETPPAGAAGSTAASVENPGAMTPAGTPGEMNAAGNPLAGASAEMTPTPATPADPLAADPTILASVPPPPAPPGTALLLTKPVEIQAKFGKIKLPPGTPVKLIQQNGTLLTVQVAGRDVTTIPASSTNLGNEIPPAVAPGLPPAPAVPPSPRPRSGSDARSARGTI